MGDLPGALIDDGTARPSGPWSQVPEPASSEPAWSSAAAFAAMCLGPLVAFARGGVGTGWLVLIAAAALVGGLAARYGRRAVGPISVVLAGIAAVSATTSAAPTTGVPPGGPRWSVVAVLVLLVAAWWMAGSALTGDEAERARRLRPAVAASAAAAAVLIALDRVGLAVVLGVLALVLAGLTALPVAPRVLGVLDRPVEVVSRAVGAVAALPALALVTLRWATDRVVGHDPLRPGRDAGWTAATGPADPLRLHAAAPSAGRWRSRLSAVLALAVLAVPVLLWFLRPAPTPTPPAVAGDPTWPTLYAESSDITRRLRLDPTTVFRLPSYKGDYVNEEDGRRRTWRPPPCQCPRYRIWWYGGSAAWGMFQRDRESIASEVAKAAWAKGVALEIENRATPGFVVDQEVRAIEADLETEEPPDLIVVLDGANDATLQVERNAVGRGDDRSGGPDIDRSLGALSDLGDLWADLRRSRLAGEVEPDPDRTVPPRGPDELAGTVAARFRSNIVSARALAAAHGTRIAFLWQPTFASTPGGSGDPAVTGEGEWGEVMRRTPAELAGYTVDLSDALVGAPGPVFVDEVHFSERGAGRLGAVVADVLLAQLGSVPPG